MKVKKKYISPLHEQRMNRSEKSKIFREASQIDREIIELTEQQKTIAELSTEEYKKRFRDARKIESTDELAQLRIKKELHNKDILENLKMLKSGKIKMGIEALGDISADGTINLKPTDKQIIKDVDEENRIESNLNRALKNLNPKHKDDTPEHTIQMKKLKGLINDGQDNE